MNFCINPGSAKAKRMTRRGGILGAGLASLLAMLPGPAASQEAEAYLGKICAGELLTFPLPPMSLLDPDEDRLISATEAAKCESLDLLFSRLDLDADGMLTVVEYAGFAALWQRRKRTF